VGGVVSKVESTRIVLAPKGAGLYCSFAGWIRVMKTLYFKFKDKVKYHSVICLSLPCTAMLVQHLAFDEDLKKTNPRKVLKDWPTDHVPNTSFSL
jgi:hypothetical protein